MNYARFNLVTLSLIVSVARAGSISGGARETNLAMAAASKRLGDFETQIGVPIFYRRSHGVELTEAGRAILNDVLNVLEDVDRLARNIAEFSSGHRGHVRIWANPAAISEALPDDIAEFSAANPDIVIEMEERDSPETVKAVVENRADIGIFADSMNTMGLETRVYREDHLALAVPEDHPLAARRCVTLAEALDYPFIGLIARTPVAARLEYESARIGKAPKVQVQVRGIEAMCRMIAAKMGIGIVPTPAAVRYLVPMGLAIVEIEGDWTRRELMIGVRDSETLTHAARLLLDHLQSKHALSIAESRLAIAV